MASRDSNLQLSSLQVSATGVVGTYDVSELTSMRIVIEDADAGNSITFRAKIKGQTAYDTILVVVGNTDVVQSIRAYDILQIEVTSYSSTTSSIKLNVSGFYYILGAEIDDSIIATDSTWSSDKISTTVLALGDKYVRSTRFEAIGSGTTGTVTIPLEQTVVLDDFGGTIDAIVTTVSGGRPTTSPAQTSGGAIVATTFDASGNYTFTGTPSTYPVTIMYRVRQKLSTYLDTDANVVGYAQYDEVQSVNGETGTVVLDTGDISSVSNSRYVSDANLVAINNTSGTNTGDVTLGTANGLSLINQQLSQGLSSSTQTGALSATDWNTFNNKQNALGYTPENVANKGTAFGYASLDADVLIPITQIPPAAIERLVIVADQAARFALTISVAQNGDTVKQVDIGEMFYIKDDTNLNNASGYAVYTAGTASSAPWSGITGIPAPVSSLTGTNTGDVTIGTANGLSLTGQSLSLGLSSTSNTGSLSSTDWNTFNNKQSSGNYITDLVGDVTGSGPGSTSTTLATVNSNVGSFGSASNVSTITLNNKGLATAAVNTPIQITESQVTNLVSDLALKAPLASPTFTGIPAAPTASLGNNSTQIATTAYVDATAAAGTPDATTLVKGKVKLAGDLAGTADLPTLKNTGTAGTYTKVTTDAQGRVSSGTTLVATDIPNLDFAKITTGIVPIAQGGRNSSTALSGSSIIVSNGTAIVQGPAGTTTTLLHGNAAGLPTYSQAVLTTDVSGILPTANGGTNKSTWTAGNIPYASTTTAFGEDATGQFTWNNTNKRLNVGAPGSGKVNTTVTTGTDPGLTAYMTGGTGNALEIKNQNAYSASLINASASATAGASIGWSFSRGTNASRTQSLSGDQIGSITGNGYTGTAFAGLTNAISFVATENTTATTTGGKIVLSTTPNGTVVPVSRVEIAQDGVVNISNLTASLPVKTDASKNLVSSAINLASSTEVTGTLPESKGGTGAAQIIKTLNTNTTSTGNTAGTETTLFTFSIPASTLSVDGNKIYGNMAGSFAGSITTDKRVKVKFGATTVFDSGTLGITSASDWYIDCLCVRISATTQICTVSFHSSSSVISASASVVTAAETLSGAVSISVTGQGTSADDVTGKLWDIGFKP